jgi:hypothetical protein
MKTVYLIGCIKRDVIRWVQKYSNSKSVDLSAWYCGVTDQNGFAELDQLLKKKGISDLYYRRWFANDPNAALEIVGFFVKNGMKTKPLKGGIRNEARFVYILKSQPNITEEVIGLLS